MQAEAAHDFTLTWLDRLYRAGLLPTSRPLAGTSKQLMGLRFANPVGLAAGLDKNAAHLDSLGSFGFGFIEVGTVTPRPQPGNPQPRMFRLTQHEALINRLGFNNQGLEHFLRNVQGSRWAAERRGVLGLNIGKNASTPIENALDDYLAGLEAVAPWADYVTVNISSPNTQGLRDLQQQDSLNRLLEGLKEAQHRLAQQHQRHVPLVLKIAPDLTDEQIREIAERLRAHSIEGVIATNTTLNRKAVDGHPYAKEHGGLSGAPLLEQSNHVIRALRSSLQSDVVIIGVGGVMSGEDAKSKLNAGADLVQLYTGLIYRGPSLVAEAVRATRSE
ncbi:MAG: quinone-dependent dihydroorotate dehydrogenase [Betaproteobacteria bacterium]|nr:quinone-dependent dihydroorotate dehydrogenase [Betaproteobacteria bacterium]